MDSTPMPPATWLVASNTGTFDADAAFADRNEIHWSETQSAHLRTGDTVYLYGTKPVQTITHECIVTEVGLPPSSGADEEQFWAYAALQDRSNRTRMKLQLVHTFTDPERASLTLPRLLENGLRAAPQGRIRAPEAVVALVSRVSQTT